MWRYVIDDALMGFENSCFKFKISKWSTDIFISIEIIGKFNLGFDELDKRVECN